MTDEEIEAIRARFSRATTGPWYVHEHGDSIGTKPCGDSEFDEVTGTRFDNDIVAGDGQGYGVYGGDAEFIAHAPVDMHTLLAEVAALREIVRAFASLETGIIVAESWGDTALYGRLAGTNLAEMYDKARALLGGSRTSEQEVE
jgi:hypothetical protein